MLLPTVWYWQWLLTVLALAILPACVSQRGEDKSKPAEAENAAIITAAPTTTDEPAEPVEPTEAQTEEPTQVPTQKPAATQIPWKLDPNGHIPWDVHVICLEEYPSNIRSCCIAKIDSEYHAMAWSNNEIQVDYVIPAEIAENAQYIYKCSTQWKYPIVQTDNKDGTITIYVQDTTLYLTGMHGYAMGTYMEVLVDDYMYCIDFEMDYYVRYKVDEELTYDAGSGSWGVNGENRWFTMIDSYYGDPEKIWF